MNISVIIPVYNAAVFIEKAVHSALFHNEVKEVVVVNDGSTDNSLQILQTLQESDSRIKIYHHENNSNKGRSASRNLALKNASQAFIAFLDADDFYLENRFDNDKMVFESNDSVDGVYNAVGFHFYREATIEELKVHILDTIQESLEPKELFDAMLSGKYGHFHIAGLTIKKIIFDRIGYFNESLAVAEDTDLILKMTLVKILVAGNIKEAVAMRGVHDTNVFNQTEVYKIYRSKMYESVIAWSFKNNIQKNKIDLILNWLFYFRYKQKHPLTVELKYWFYLLKKEPKLLQTNFAFKYCPIIRKRKQLFPFLFR